MLIDKAVEGRTAGAAVEPKDERVISGAPLRLHKVVEQVAVLHLIHCDVPAKGQAQA